MNRSFFRAGMPLLISVVPLLPLVFVAGCGGANNPGAFVGGTGTTGGAASGLASRSFSSNVALSGGKAGALALNVAADGTTVTGTLTVSDASRAQGVSRQAQSFNFASGTYSIRGTVDPTTGVFTMTGSIGGQAFSFNGTLPTPGNGNVGGAYTLTAGGETYSGSFVTVVPTPGTTPNPTATPGSGSVGQGGTQTLTFTNNTSNISTAPFTSAEITGIATSSQGANAVTASLIVKPAAGSTSLVGVRGFTISTTKASGAVATGSYPVNDYAGGTIVIVGLYEYAGTASAYEQRILTASSGTVEIVSLSSTQVTFRLKNVVLDGTLLTKGTGSVTVNGDLTANITK